MKNLFPPLKRLLFYNRFLGYSKYRLTKYVQNISKSLIPHKKILDAGAGECQYKQYFKNMNYVSQDLCIGDIRWDFSQIDIKSEIYDIPVKNHSFDYILCIEVLEHLKYPDRVFAEFSRILKQGGKLFLICPLVWGEHQKPHDYFRYTQFALQLLGNDNGFTLKKIEKQGGKFICLTQIITEIAPSFFIERKLILLGYIFKILLYPINFTIGFIFYFLDKIDKDKDLTSQYECTFIKK
ncbi:MAG: class I SAM-dependent methyltransferase [Candidatus Shapirobacteria bacterium]|jgi:SAM-dependent methyltransferase